jgi:excinuclease UvrABC nuclease subunit
LPGIYQIGTDFEVNRVRGSTKIIYIGSAKNLRNRLLDRVKNPRRHLKLTARILLQAGHKLEFRFLTAENYTNAIQMENEALRDYVIEYWENPPGLKLPTASLRLIEEQLGI